jgi:hypothetical protein
VGVSDELRRVTRRDWHEAFTQASRAHIVAYQDRDLGEPYFRSLVDEFPALEDTTVALQNEVRANPGHGDHRCTICFLEGMKWALEALTLL